jgi:hypothetical protein
MYTSDLKEEQVKNFCAIAYLNERIIYKAERDVENMKRIDKTYLE